MQDGPARPNDPQVVWSSLKNAVQVADGSGGLTRPVHPIKEQQESLFTRHPDMTGIRSVDKQNAPGDVGVRGEVLP